MTDLKGSKISLDLDIDLKEVYKQTADFQSAFQKKSVLKSIGLRLLKWTNDNFRGEGKLVGGWRPLSEKTLARRRKSSDKILQDTGELRKSFDRYGSDGYKIGSSYVQIGTKIDYAAAHHFGYRPRNLPERQILPDKKTATKLSIGLLEARLKNLRAKHG